MRQNFENILSFLTRNGLRDKYKTDYEELLLTGMSDNNNHLITDNNLHDMAYILNIYFESSLPVHVDHSIANQN